MSERCDQNLFALFAERMRAQPEAPAIRTPDGTSLSYEMLDTQSGRYAAALLELGLQKGDRVLVQASAQERGAPIITNAAIEIRS